MKVKLVRSRRLKRVLLLECGKDFADKLLGFLVMPVSNMMQLLGSSLVKDGNALYNVYTSMTKIEGTAFSTSAAKTVLMDPSSCYTFRGGNAVFLIGEDLSISRSSISMALQLLEAVEGNFRDIDCKEIEAGEETVLLLVKAALASRTPLTDVFGTSFEETKS
ncbi:hypothetical protein R1sor_021480 [Riccia sorocarpa]|uniref:Uncharacterized protein n=1 Tax=Riccia sorocarpa TaxID=122646 RepID=A0ABD3GJB7_9MARC